MLGGIVRGERVTLRTPREADLVLVSSLMADMRVRRMGEVWHEPATTTTWKERLAEVAKDQRDVMWTIDAGAETVGLARISFEHDDPGRCFIRQLVIDPLKWGHGLGTEAARVLHRFLFDYLDKRGAAVKLPADNERALRIAAALGYREFARGHEVWFRDGAYVDEVWLRLDRPVWNERFGATDREYEPFVEGIEG